MRRYLAPLRRARLSAGRAARAARDGLLTRVRQGRGHLWDSLSNPNTVHAFKLTLDHRRDRGAAEHDLRRRLRARDRPPPLPGRRDRERDRRPAARALPGRRRPLALPALRPHRLVRPLVRSARHPDPVRAAVDGDRDHLRLAARSSRARSCRRCARSATSRSRPRTRSAPAAWHDVLADHAAVDPLGGDLRRRADDRALPRRVRRRRGRLRPHRGPDRDRDPARPGRLRELRPRRRVRHLARARRHLRDRPGGDDAAQAQGGAV